MPENREESARCGPDSASWFMRGAWPTCACGFDPRDNAALQAHWATQGFRVVDENGSLVEYSAASRSVGDVIDLAVGTGQFRKHVITSVADDTHFTAAPIKEGCARDA